MMPEDWRPEHKLFPHQVGFTCPPFDWDAAPSDFSRIAPSTVGVHGWMLHVPDYVHRLDQRKANFGMMNDFCHVMSRNGADVAAQVGSDWVHASGLGVPGIADPCAQKIADVAHGFANANGLPVKHTNRLGSAFDIKQHIVEPKVAMNHALRGLVAATEQSLTSRRAFCQSHKLRLKIVLIAFAKHRLGLGVQSANLRAGLFSRDDPILG